ncbi:MAG: hypothetical protein LQ340_006295, partial [Diploschistes diacapsis]
MPKARVYGRKTRNITAVENKIFITSSSGPEGSPKHATVLTERSHNARLRQHEERPDKAAPLGDALTATVEQRTDPKEGNESQALSGPSDKSRSATRPRRAPPKKQPRPLETAIQENLGTALESLHLDGDPLQSTSNRPSCSTRPSPAPVPKIPPCAATISPLTRSYLQPLLSLKSISPTVEDFSLWLSSRSHLSLTKIGEGSFGEVYRATSTTASTSPHSSATTSSVILKLLPLCPPRGPGCRSYTSIPSAAREIRLLSLLQRVPGFVEFRGACVLQGSMPARLAELWRGYRDSGRTVESRDPGARGAYPRSQLWL